MADYFTHFCCAFDVGSARNAAAALRLLATMRAGSEPDMAPESFLAEADPARPGTLILSDEDGYGEPEDVIAFVLRCAEAFALTGRWGFVWALTCSRARLDGFGGGAELLDLGAGRSLASLDCEHWLAAGLTPNDAP